jgi:hypothetical protein
MKKIWLCEVDHISASVSLFVLSFITENSELLSLPSQALFSSLRVPVDVVRVHSVLDASEPERRLFLPQCVSLFDGVSFANAFGFDILCVCASHGV